MKGVWLHRNSWIFTWRWPLNQCAMVHALFVLMLKRVLRLLRAIPHHRPKHRVQPPCQFIGNFHHHDISSWLWHLDIGDHRLDDCDDHRQHVWSHVLLVDTAQCTLIGQSCHDCGDFCRVLLTHRSCICIFNKADTGPACTWCHC